MRITYLHQYFNTPLMSGGTRSYEMARRLVAMGHEVNMVTSWREADGRKDWFTTDEAGIKVHWLPVPYSNHMSYNQRIVSFFKFAWGAARKAASFPADVVFATSTPLTIALPGVYAARRQRVPMVFEVRDLWPEVPIAMGALSNPLTIRAAYVLENFALRNSSHVVALFERARDSVLKKGIHCSHVSVIPNGADLADYFLDQKVVATKRAELFIDADRLVILYPGTFGKVNGVDYIVDLAVQLIDDPRFFFILVGDGVEKSIIIVRAEEKRVLGSNLIIHEQVSKAEIAKYLAASDILISTVIPLKLLEADSANKVFDGLAAGRMVAVNHGGHLAELLEETGAGIQLDQDVKVAAQQFKDLADHPERLAYAKLAARKLAEDRFSRDKLAEQLEQVLVSAVTAYSRSS